jgi:hypothetical protein
MALPLAALLYTDLRGFGSGKWTPGSPAGEFAHPKIRSRESQVMAQLRQADHGRTCPLIGVKRSRRLLARNDAIDPDVWSRRASQEVFVEVAVSGLVRGRDAHFWAPPA